MTQSQFNGPQYFLRGLKMLARKPLLPYVLIPLTINVIFFAAMTWLVVHELTSFNAWVTGLLPSWLAWLNWLLWVIGLLVMLVVFMYLFTIVANFFGAPFNGFLAEKVEEILTGQKINQDNTWSVFVKQIPYMLKQQLRLLGYYLPRAVICLLLFLIPVVQLAAGVIWLLFSIWMLALQYLTYPMENHLLPFTEIRARLRSNLGLSMGFGGITMLFSIIPVLNLLVMPAAVAGATILWVENNQLINQPL